MNFKQTIKLSIFSLLFLSQTVFSQTMTFDANVSHAGFTFNNWSWDSPPLGIFSSNLASPSTISVNAGTFTPTSFEVTDVDGLTEITVTSNKGASSLVFTTIGVKNLSGADFTSISTLTFTRTDANGGIASTIDNIVYSLNTDPAISIDNSTLAYTENGAATQIDLAGTLTDADGDVDWNGGKLEVQITVNNEAADELSILDNIVGTINTSGTNLQNGGTVIGALSVSEGTVTNGTKLTITFNGSSTDALVQQVLRAIHYRNTSNDPGIGNRLITFTATDKNSASDSDTRTVGVIAVNDAPTLTATGENPTFNEGGAASDIYSGVTVSTIESGQTITELKITVTNVNNGVSEILSVDGSDVTLTNGTTVPSTATNAMAVSVSVTGSTATLTITKGAGITTAQMQTLVDGITYKNTNDNPNTSDRVVTLTYIKDNGLTANSGDDDNVLSVVSTVTVNAVNDPPVLDNTKSPVLTGILEDLGNPTNGLTANSTLVSALVDNGGALSNFTDAEGDPPGIAVTAVSQGTLWYTVNGGTNWTQLGVVNATSALILNTGATTRIYFKPNANVSGTVADAITIKVWDRTSGNNGDLTVNTSLGTAFSTATDVVGITITDVNDAPTLTATGENPTFTEDGAASDIYSGVTVSTIEAGQTITELRLTVTNVNNGVSEILSVDGSDVTLTNGTTVPSTATNAMAVSVSVTGSTATITITKGAGITTAQMQTLVDGITYKNTNDNPNTSDRVVTLTYIKDNGLTANSGDDDAVLSVVSTVTVNAVNDAPVLNNTKSPVLTGILEDLGNPTNGSTANSTLVSALVDNGGALSNFTDAEGDPTGIAVTAVSQGTLWYTVNGGTNWTQLGVVNATSALILNTGATTRIYFKPNANVSGTVADAITIKAWDRTSGSNGDLTVNTTLGTAFSTATDVVGITITDVNDAPTLTATGENPTFNEDGAASDIYSALTVSAIESGQTITELRLTVTNVNNGVSEILSVDGSDVTLTNGTTVPSTATNAMAAGVSVTGSTATLTITKGAGITNAQMQTLVDGITYKNTNDNPNTSDRVVTLTYIKDNGLTANSGDDDNVLSVASTVTLTPVNDPPVVSNVFGDNSSEVVAGTGAQNVTDLDDATVSNTDSPDYDGGFFTITQSLGTFNGSWGLDGTTVTSGGDGVIVAGETIVVSSGSLTLGTVHATNDGQGGNDLEINFSTANATSANIQILIRSLTYSAPSGLDARTFALTLNDNDGTANSGDEDASGNFVITVTPNPPVIANLNGDNPTIPVGGTLGNIDVDGNATVTDADSPNFNGGNLSIVQNTGTSNGNFSVDGTTVTSGGDATIAAAEAIAVSGTPIGTVTTNGQGGNDLEITLNLNATTALTQTLLKNIKYAAASGTGDRTFTITIQDAAGGSNPASGTANITITIAPPEMDLKQGSTSIADGGSYNFGDKALNSNSDIVFTIHNTAAGALSITTPITIGGADAGQFSTQVQPSATVAGNDSTTFTIRFTPTSTGAKTVTIAITNSDSDENPYNITLNGFGGPPEINISQGATSIADGGTYAFGSKIIGSATDIIFTIENSGLGNLDITTPITLGGADAGLFSIQQQPTASVAAAGNTTFIIRFYPTSEGSKTATIDIANTDSDENPYNIIFTGYGIDPISPNIQAQSIEFTNVHSTKLSLNWRRGNGDRSAVFIVEDSIGTAVPNDDTNYYANSLFKKGSQIGSTGWYCVYSGTGTTVDITGLLPGSNYRAMVCEYNKNSGYYRFNLNADKDNILSQRTRDIFINEFDPNSATSEFIELYDGGIGNTSLDNITVVSFNGNTDLSYNSFTLTGSTTDDNGYLLIDNISIQDENAAITLYLDDIENFPNGTAVTTKNLIDAVVYDSTNNSDEGLLALLLGGGQLNENGRGSLENHSLQRMPNGNGGYRNTSFFVSETPTPKTENAALSLITLEGNSNPILNGDTTTDDSNYTAFINTSVKDATSSRMFTIKNKGLAVLKIDSINISGNNNSEFSITSMPNLDINVNNSESFTVTFDPLDGGKRIATINIYHNDASHNPFRFDISGLGSESEILVMGNGKNVTNGNNTPSDSNYTAFVNTAVDKGFTFRNYTIKNNGLETLNIDSITIYGSNKDDFSLISQLQSIIEANDSTTFTIQFNPSAEGIRTAKISIYHSASENNPYEFNVSGNGLIPKLDLFGKGEIINNGDITPSVTNGTDFGKVVIDVDGETHSFSIKNNGTVPLTISGTSTFVTITGHSSDFILGFIPNNVILGVSESTTFTIKFTPKSPGLREVEVSINSNDLNNNPYTFKIKGIGDSQPVGMDGVIEINEDEIYTFVENDFNFNDADGDNFAGILIDSLETFGNLEYNGSSVTIGLKCVDISNLKFIPELNSNGSPYSTFFYKLIDENGNFSLNVYSITINVLSVVEPPILGINSGFTVNENGKSIFSSSVLSTSDPDGDSGLLKYTISKSPAFGVLYVDSLISNNTIEQVLLFTQNDIDSGFVKYLHDGSEALVDSFKFFVSDIEGGKTSEETFIININNVNDSPIFSSLPNIIVNEDDKYTISFLELQIFVQDPDISDTLLSVNLVSQNENISIVSSENKFEISFEENWFGTGSYLFSASDGKITIDTLLAITVLPVNDLPAVTGIPSSIEFEESESGIIDLFDKCKDVETADSLLTYTFSSDPDSIKIVFENKTKILTLESIAGFVGEAILSITIMDSDSGSITHDISVLVTPSDITGIKQLAGIPQEYSLDQNYPNPFNPMTKIRFGLPEKSEVSLKIYDILGREIATLVNTTLVAGYYEFNWNAITNASGIYFYIINANDGKGFRKVKKMILIK